MGWAEVAFFIWGRNRAQFPPMTESPLDRVCPTAKWKLKSSCSPSSLTTQRTALLEGKQGLSGCTAWLCRRPMRQWERLVYFLRLSAPQEGALWIRVQVKPLTKRYAVDKGEFRTRPVNVMDCHAQTALFVEPFTRLYQVRRRVLT
jgi:hypothetical protein